MRGQYQNRQTNALEFTAQTTSTTLLFLEILASGGQEA
jgi:hypothetical protein